MLAVSLKPVGPAMILNVVCSVILAGLLQVILLCGLPNLITMAPLIFPPTFLPAIVKILCHTRRQMD